ncbi:hypothetical protein A1359_19885 [Methylomonas lenta]|uniref:Uncharacterized protein n=1 Tax=Methylomonas lenta TaxID=980561 RepID=A0A177NV34_9GAMM|nr:nitroreductase family protein [Methylomonas lenta]OAI21133.1 hypothetical protein A1359_19885 [Methylomonas lenta]
MDRQIIEKILEAAVKAPSGDNVQPWRFEVSQDWARIDLFNLPERDDSYYNYQQAAAYIAHGAVIENIAIASRHLGCMVKLKLFPEPQNPSYVASFEFESASAVDDPLYPAIFTRETNRFHFQDVQLPAEDAQQIIDSIKQVEGVKGYFVHDVKTVKTLAKVIMVNDRVVFEHKEIHSFLFDKIRWNQKQIEETQDGMPVGTLGLNPIEKLFFPLMRFWWFVDLANYVGLSRIIGAKCWYNCQNAALIGQVTVQKTDSLGFIQAGRALQRVWLEAARQGLAFQPIVGLPLLIHRAQENALEAFSETHRNMLEQAKQSLFGIFGIDQSETLAVGFRIGKCKSVAEKTLRKAV